jgi:phosphotransferase system enzyme I (PtsI)
MQEADLKDVHIDGLTGSDGIVIGPLLVVNEKRTLVQPKKINLLQVNSHQKRFQKAKEIFLKEISLLSDNLDASSKEILETQRHIISDVEIHDQINERIEKDHFSVDYAIFTTFSNFIERLRESGSELFQQRIIDLENLRDRLIDLSCENEKNLRVEKGAILVLRDISPTDLVAYHERGVAGLVMDKGGVTSHAAIIAQSLNIPCIVSAKNAVKRSTGIKNAVLDATAGELVLNPTGKTLSDFKKRLKEQQKAQRAILRAKENSETKDGVNFTLRANIEFVQELPLLKKNRAEGIGLLRTEALLYGGMMRKSEEEQDKFYKTILAQTKGPVVIRLFDVGGDKLTVNKQEEDNPFLGWRGIRMLLDEQEMLTVQLRSILKISGEHPGRVKILVPMVTVLDEVTEVKQAISEVQKELAQQGTAFDQDIEIGVMVEVPSVALMAAHFAEEVDFLSVGSNDLTQYTLAVDRGNERICSLYQHHHPSVLQLIYQTVRASVATKTPISVCGELAGDLMGAAFLLGSGVYDLSMSPQNIPKVNHFLFTHTQKELEEFAQKALRQRSAQADREVFKALFL